jgi:putative addiction module component (TIGR02574 family)
MHADFEHLRQLPIAEKLRIVEALWDDICESQEPIPLHPWQIEEVKRRAAELDANPDLAITEEELWRRVDELRG